MAAIFAYTNFPLRFIFVFNAFLKLLVSKWKESNAFHMH